MISAGIRPRPLTSSPCSWAQTRTAFGSACVDVVARERLERLRLTGVGFRAAATYLPRAFRRAAAFMWRLRLCGPGAVGGSKRQVVAGVAG